MNADFIAHSLNDFWQRSHALLRAEDTYLQLGVILLCYLLAHTLYFHTLKRRSEAPERDVDSRHPLVTIVQQLSTLVSPLTAIILLRISRELGEALAYPVWLVNAALVIAVLLFFNSMIREFVRSQFMSKLFRWLGLPLLFLHLIGVLPFIVHSLEDVSLSIGNIEISLYGFFRVLFFGTVLFWLGRASSSMGKDIIRNQKSLDITTREVFTKLFEVGLFCVSFLVLLNIMGINLTTLAVFGGALGVGLGLGLQSIASNFISGIIILLDKSLTVGDYIELADGKKGFVREFNMRHAVLETYDGKDILVPNETFISSSLINWTHKDPKQRYRVDFSVAYATDIRALVEIIKEAVSKHPQVIGGPDVPIEERPDCEIDSFGDNGVNMFVEFWIEGVDDGKNRVGGDLLLTIFETLREHQISIPFPQREVTILNAGFVK